MDPLSVLLVTTMSNDLEFAIDVLESRIAELRKERPVSKDIGKLDSALNFLRQCVKVGLSNCSKRSFTVLPQQSTRAPSSCYRVCEDHESDLRSAWTEVKIDGDSLELHEGDIVISIR